MISVVEPVFSETCEWVAHTLLTADQCARTDVYQMHAGTLVCYEDEWSPWSPHDETDFVSLELHGPNGDTLTSDEISGEAHRDLETAGNLDRFIAAYIVHRDISGAASAVGLMIQD
jgi:hypothetical protein